MLWGPRGKDLLVVYSDSPFWKEYFEKGLLPQIEKRSNTLNWSKRSSWSAMSLSVIAFRLFMKEKEYNPIVMLFPFLHWPKQVHYYQAFKDFKHGRENTLNEVENQLFIALEKAIKNPHPRITAKSV